MSQLKTIVRSFSLASRIFRTKGYARQSQPHEQAGPFECLRWQPPPLQSRQKFPFECLGFERCNRSQSAPNGFLYKRPPPPSAHLYSLTPTTSPLIWK